MEKVVPLAFTPCAAQLPQDVDVSARYLVLASAAALLSYIEHIQNVTIMGHSVRVVWQAAEGRMV